MPIYEYRCRGCGREFSKLILTAAESQSLECPQCRGRDLERLMSRFRAVRSQESRLERLADPSSLGGLDENDPASVAKWAKKMGREVGEDLGDDFDQMVDEAVEEEAHRGGDENLRADEDTTV
jgi:putative FmdB family regulatory protein